MTHEQIRAIVAEADRLIAAQREERAKLEAALNGQQQRKQHRQPRPWRCNG